MGKSKSTSFSQEDIQLLKRNPYTAAVTKTRLSLTLEAKEMILDSHHAGWAAKRIMEEFGYDPEILGSHRLSNIVRNVCSEAESKHGLHEGYFRAVGTRKKNLSLSN